MKYETEYFFYPFIFHRLEHISEEHQHLSAAYSDITDRYCVPIDILIFFLNNTKKCKIQKSKYIDWNKCWIFILFFHRRSVYANLLIKNFFQKIWIVPENLAVSETRTEDLDRNAWDSAETQRISEAATWSVSM